MVFSLKGRILILIRIILGFSFIYLKYVECEQDVQSGSRSKTSALRFSNQFVSDAVHQHNDQKSQSQSQVVRSSLELPIEEALKKVVIGTIHVELGDSPEWSWVLAYVDTNWAQLYRSYESTGASWKNQERLRIEKNMANCLDEVGCGSGSASCSSKFCEHELVDHFVQEAALRIVAARTYAEDMSYVAVGKISMINDMVFEGTGQGGILAKFLCPLLTLKYFLPPDPRISLTLGVIVGLFIDGDTDTNFSLDRREFYVLETKKGDGNLREADVNEYFNRIDINHNGKLSWFEFVLVPICTMHICFRDLNVPDVGGGGAGSQPLADQLKAGDRNGDGFLSMAELSASAKGLVLTIDDSEDLAEIDDIFDLFDEDQDGRVSFAEIDAVFTNMQFEPPPPPQFMPSGQNGALTRADMTQLAKTVQHRLGQKIDIDAIMMMLDKNGNGVIDKTEQQLIANLLKLV